jgi:hemerythrin superfamily protein
MADSSISRRRAALLAGGAMALAAAPLRRAVAAASDPFQDLAADHRKLVELVARMLQTSETATNDRVALLGELKGELARHAAVEEYVLYPALRQNPDFKRVAQDFCAEHGDLKTLLYELELMPRSDVRWGQKAGDLRRLLEAHHRREEEDVFPKYRASLNATQFEFLSQLAQRERGHA